MPGGDLELALRIKSDFKDPQRDLVRLNKQIGKTGTQASKSSRRMHGFAAGINRASAAAKRARLAFAGLMGVLAGLAAIGVYRALSAIRDAGVAMQQVEARFVSATGSIAAARKELEFLRGTADDLGLDFLALSDGFSSLSAAAQGTALAGEPAREILLGVASAASALQLNAESTGGVLRALEQIISKGNVQAEELRGQLGERLPGAFRLAAESMGVSTQELNKMLDRGEVLAEDLLPKLAAKLRETYGRDARRASSLFTGEVNRLRNAFVELGATVADTGVLDFMTAAARAATAVTEKVTGLITGVDDITRLSRELDYARSRLDRFEGQTIKVRISIDFPALKADIARLEKELSNARLLRELRRQRLERAFPTPLNIQTIMITKSITAKSLAAADSIRTQIDALRGVEQSLSEKIEKQLAAGEFGDLAAEGEARLRSLAAQYDELNRTISSDEARSQVLEMIREAEFDLASPHDQARESARRWKDDIQKLLVESGLDYEDYAKTVESIQQRMTAESQTGAMSQVMSTLREAQLSLADPYDQAVAEVERWREETLRLLQDSGQDHEEFVSQVETIYSEKMARAAEEAAERQLRAATDWKSGATRALRDIAADASEVGDEVESAMSEAFSRLEDVIVDFVTTGKASFGDFVNFVIQEFVRIQVRKHFIAPFSEFVEGVIGHSGAVAGAAGGVRRMVDPRVFAFAPRYHAGGVAGLGPNEIPVIARRGETILSSDQAKALGARLNETHSVSIEFVNQGTPQEEVSRTARVDGGRMMVSVVVDDVGRNGPVARSLQRTYGLQRSVA